MHDSRECWELLVSGRMEGVITCAMMCLCFVVLYGVLG